MAAGPITTIGDVIIPRKFTPYVQQQTEEKSRIIQSGAAVRDTDLDARLAGGGLTFDSPSWQDLDNDEERVSTGTASIEYSGGSADPDPQKIQTSNEVQVRLSRNNSWSASDLAGTLAGSDPMAAIGSRVGAYWARRLQAAFVATMKGVFADNAAPPGNGEHVQHDMTHDVSADGFTNGVTNFSAEGFVDAALSMGDSMESLTMILVHSIVYGRMQKNNLIDFIPDSEGKIVIPTFLQRRVVVDDGMPFSEGIFESWFFGGGAVRLGVGTPAVPTEIERHPGAGSGGGQEVLWNRVEWVIHPVGYAYVGTAPSGGPNNSSDSHMLAAAGSWKRVFPERKQIKIARLITREF